MLYAASFALVDSLNVLLIGVLFATAVMHSRTRKYGRVAALLIFGDWLGVCVLSLLTMAVFDGIGDLVRDFLGSPVLAIVLILTGILSALLTFRGGDPAPIIQRLAQPLQMPRVSTIGAGVALGLIQSATSVPFFTGLAFLSATDLPTYARYLGVIIYASVALSVPALCGVLIGTFQRFPGSPIGRFVDFLHRHGQVSVAAAGYAVAAVLILIGVLHVL